ncbi:MAG: helicase/secretion neighborhood putative DEAH-box helicase [Acidimicrobiales bacterium]|nr:helicase/secretion neighborhood putative DEAH-box helicase [Acidimicrobiales bacterium]
MRPELDDLVAGLASCDQLVHLERIPPRSARTATLATPLPKSLERLVPPGGLWSHQAAAVDLARAGHSVAVATGTASGKSLCYQLPIAEAATHDPPSTALLVYPTKALAQDQLRSLAALDVPGLVPVTYDGDTPPNERTWARRHANVVLTNPDMLHVGILPHHGRWATFLMRLRYVVLDELHTLRGIFGSHVAHLLRRLRRLCAHYGSDPTFVFGSATIGRPSTLASALCGLPVAEVDDDGSPRGERLFALWNPPITDERSGARASSNIETADLLAALVRSGYRGIAFTRSRKGSELVASYARRRLPEELASMVRPYRGGYLAAERREIETELFEGRLAGVSTTSALELGIDVGTLDACVLDGFPGTIASMWQQAGRAGRTRQRSLAVLVAGEDQLDQWLMAHPTEVFTRPPEPAVVNPANPFVLLPHVACAAYEKPLVPEDETFWSDLGDGVLEDAVRQLVVADRLRVRGGRAFHAGRGAPASSVGLRTGSSAEYRIVDEEGRLIGTVDESRAYSLVHPGALYLHQGQQYRVTTLDLDDRAAWVEPSKADEYTQPRTDTNIRILAEDDSTTVGRAQLSLGAVEVTEQVVAFQRKHLFTGEVLGMEDLDLPPTRLETRAFWYTIGDDVLAAAGLVAARVPGTVHAAEHAGIGILPLFTICDRWDVGGVSTPWQAQTGRATIVIYDGYPGGAGIAELGFAAGRRHVEATLEVISTCPCEAGCPSCVQSPKCGNWNEPLDKQGAVALLRTILGLR